MYNGDNFQEDKCYLFYGTPDKWDMHSSKIRKAIFGADSCVTSDSSVNDKIGKDIICQKSLGKIQTIIKVTYVVHTILFIIINAISTKTGDQYQLAKSEKLGPYDL